jgi:predicted GIY-YIG superfamily endonuclease
VALVYSEPCASLGAALRREHELKRWTRARKEALLRDGAAAAAHAGEVVADDNQKRRRAGGE